MPSHVGSSPVVSLTEFEEAASYVSAHAYHTPLLTSRLLSERTGFDIRLKAEMFQKGGSYKVRGPLNKLRHRTAEQRRRGVICSSVGKHAPMVQRSCNTAQTETKRTRRPNSCVRRATLPTSILLTTCNSSRARERWA